MAKPWMKRLVRLAKVRGTSRAAPAGGGMTRGREPKVMPPIPNPEGKVYPSKRRRKGRFLPCTDPSNPRELDRHMSTRASRKQAREGKVRKVEPWQHEGNIKGM